jgi:hypothetical protein
VKFLIFLSWVVTLHGQISSGLKPEAIHFSKKLVSTNKSTKCYNPKHHHHHTDVVYCCLMYSLGSVVILSGVRSRCLLLKSVMYISFYLFFHSLFQGLPWGRLSF